MNRPHITLALGGGGARGVAHLGVIEVLDDAGYGIERIFGISIGSLVGALYAFDPDIDRVQKRTLDYLLSPSFQGHQQVLFGARPAPEETATGGVFNWYSRVKSYLRANRLFHRVILQPSLLPGIILQEVVDHLLPDVDIADAKIPLCVVAVDLRSGKRVVLEKGSLRSAVCGSSALPGIFPPVEHEGMLLCDVGVLYSLPTTVARHRAPELLVAVDVSSEVKVLQECETALDVLMRMDEVGEALFRDYLRKAADVVIRPQVAGIEWFDFSSAAQIMEAGRVAARAALAGLPLPLPRSVATEDVPALGRFRRWFASLVR